jgi:hypothetical protein
MIGKKSLTGSSRQFIYCLEGNVKKKMGATRHTRKDKALSQCQERYEALKSQVGKLGYVMQGSVVRRTKRCGHPGCQCHLGAEYEHGPYYQWTRKIQAKTVTRILNPTEARLYQDFIRNGRRLRKLVSRMYDISGQAAGYLADDKTRE